MRHVHDFNIKTLDVQFVHVIGNIFHVSFDLSIDIINVCKKIVSKLRLSNNSPNDRKKFISRSYEKNIVLDESGFPAIRADSHRSTFQTRCDTISLYPRLYLSI